MWKVVLCFVLAAATASKLPAGYVRLYSPPLLYPQPEVFVDDPFLNRGGYKQTHGTTYVETKKEEVQPALPYSFDFNGQTDDSATFYRKESGDDKGFKTGSYGYKDAFGVYRQVDYVADDNGFRAVIKTNEPGSHSADPADVQVTAEESPIKYVPPAKPSPSKEYQNQQSYGNTQVYSTSHSEGEKTQGYVPSSKDQQSQSHGNTQVYTTSTSYGGKTQGFVHLHAVPQVYVKSIDAQKYVPRIIY